MIWHDDILIKLAGKFLGKCFISFYLIFELCLCNASLDIASTNSNRIALGFIAKRDTLNSRRPYARQRHTLSDLAMQMHRYQSAIRSGYSCLRVRVCAWVCGLVGFELWNRWCSCGQILPIDVVHRTAPFRCPRLSAHLSYGWQPLTFSYTKAYLLFRFCVAACHILQSQILKFFCSWTYPPATTRHRHHCRQRPPHPASFVVRWYTYFTCGVIKHPYQKSRACIASGMYSRTCQVLFARVVCFVFLPMASRRAQAKQRACWLFET